MLGGEPCSDVLVPVLEVVKGWAQGWRRVGLRAGSALGCQVVGALHGTPKGKNIFDNPIIPRRRVLGLSRVALAG